MLESSVGSRAVRKERAGHQDAAPTERLNRILWGNIKGWNTPYPGARQSVFSPLAIDGDDDEGSGNGSEVQGRSASTAGKRIIQSQHHVEEIVE
jgi:hypothetical protein